MSKHSQQQTGSSRSYDSPTSSSVSLVSSHLSPHMSKQTWDASRQPRYPASLFEVDDTVPIVNSRHSRGKSVSSIPRNSLVSRAVAVKDSCGQFASRRWAAVKAHRPKWMIRAAETTTWRSLKKYASFVGPGMMVSIAYMDPGNYSTDAAAGAHKQYALLFVILLSNILAIFLQSLATKLGTVTGLDLAASCRKHFPPWLSIVLYFFAEAAIIATDIAEVIGTAIALNILMHIPLIAGVLLTIVDVLLVLLAYQPGKGMTTVRLFEYGVTVLLFGVVICFAVELSRIPPTNVGHILKGYLPSREVISDGGLYLACGVLGATVMPHSLYLGSALVKPRVRDYDIRHGHPYAIPPSASSSSLSSQEEPKDPEDVIDKYVPSIGAIRSTLKYSIIELIVSLCTVALFVNSAILIVAGSTMYRNPEAMDADLYGIYRMLGQLLSKSAGTLFMVALLFSGQSAGIICTIAGQIVSEGHVNWKMRPWIRRIITRAIAIVPCVVVVGAVGKEGLNSALNASQVALSILLPFLTAPLIYLTSRKHVMSVPVTDDNGNVKEVIDMSNSWAVCVLGFFVWLFIAVLNVYLLVQLGMYGAP